MGLFKSLKGDHPETVGGARHDSHRNPNVTDGSSGTSASTYNSFTRLGEQHNQDALPSNSPRGQRDYDPPPGPPPGRSDYQLSARPPPVRDEYPPPVGPPPSHSRVDGEPPPYHDWTSVPDTALLPPPPKLKHETSPANNADPEDADRAHDWCRHHPLVQPHQPTLAQQLGVNNGDVGVLKPTEYRGDLSIPSIGTWKGSTRLGSHDSCLITASPLYFASLDSPWKTKLKKIIYFEIYVKSLGRSKNINDSSIAIGFCAMPYPTWRLPGWERGSLAVHGDDGRRYVNDTWGGKDFTSAFGIGDTIGLGISFSVPELPPDYGVPKTSSRLKAEVFFTRNGRMEGGWDLHEELDASSDLGIEGLDGQFDLYGAVGSFGSVEFDCQFRRNNWLYLPR